MGVAALIVSVVAIGVALSVSGFGIWFQWSMYQNSSAQLGESAKVLAKLEGVSLQLRGTQEAQFNKLLDAVVKQDAGQAATVLGERLKELEQELEKRSVDASIVHELRDAVQDMQQKTNALDEQSFASANRTRSKRDLKVRMDMLVGLLEQGYAEEDLKRYFREARSSLGRQAELEAEGMDRD